MNANDTAVLVCLAAYVTTGVSVAILLGQWWLRRYTSPGVHSVRANRLMESHYKQPVEWAPDMDTQSLRVMAEYNHYALGNKR